MRISSVVGAPRAGLERVGAKGACPAIDYAIGRLGEQV
jgi:hypothetical protein